MLKTGYSGHFMTKKPFKVMVSIITLWAFLFNALCYDVTWAVNNPVASSNIKLADAVSLGSLKELHVSTFVLPDYLGSVKDSWGPEGGTVAKRDFRHSEGGHRPTEESKSEIPAYLQVFDSRQAGFVASLLRMTTVT